MAKNVTTKITRAAVGRGRYRVEAEARRIGRDVVIIIWGGTKPHIGSIAVALPRPSLADPQKMSATSSVFNLVGHKDDLVARMFAEKIAAALRHNTVATAGIHIDNIEKEGIRKFLVNCEQLSVKLLNKLGKIK